MGLLREAVEQLQIVAHIIYVRLETLVEASLGVALLDYINSLLS